MSILPVRRKDWTDIEFTAITTSVSEHVVEYVVYAIEGVTTEGIVLWHAAGATWPDPVADLTQAEIYLHGSVKWDGCSNWHFDEQDRLMLHGCTRRDLMNLGEVLARCWDWTRELLPNFEGEKADAPPVLSPTPTLYGKQIAGSVVEVAIDQDEHTEASPAQLAKARVLYAWNTLTAEHHGRLSGPPQTVADLSFACRRVLLSAGLRFPSSVATGG